MGFKTWKTMGVGSRGVRRLCACVAAAGAVGLAGVLGGCQTTGGGPVGGRPMVAGSAVEGSWEHGSVLDFFDSLEGKPLVCHDEVLHGALLIALGTSDGTYEGRVSMARRFGYVDPGFNRPAREAATIGEVAKVLVRVTDGPRSAGVGAGLTQDAAIQRLAERGWLPRSAKAFQGLSGAQYLTLVAGATEAMAGRPPRNMVDEPSPTDSIPGPSEPAPRVEQAATVEPVSAATGSAAPEPLAPVAPAVVSQPVPLEPAPTRHWVPGRPLKKPQ